MANWEIQLRPDRDGSTNPGWFLIDSSLNWGGEKEPQRGLCPLLAITSAIPVSPVLTSDVESPRFECCYVGVQAKIVSHQSRLGGSRSHPHRAREEKGCTFCCSGACCDSVCAASQTEPQQKQQRQRTLCLPRMQRLRHIFCIATM